ncbi:hypothetical protein B0H17DRAFT_1210765 [Mycena rosella]|uniref:Ribonuclease H1 N-terminal domain-containing protein n=1 Tax=Mycena rosella TaxID=1033263 RepID=A0AAD7CVH4_MYCRO|nr:hypothetical protein B0H17DRAFT_1210765 [Mycena rosella]
MPSTPKLALTNLQPEEVVMDTRGGKDARYYCLLPFRGQRQEPVKTGGAGFPWHLVFQGHRVGMYNSWPEAKASLSGFSGSGNRGYHSEEECIDGGWQQMCVLGIHPHPVDPAFLTPPSPSASSIVNVSPRKSSQKTGRAPAVPPRPSPIKREGAGLSCADTQVLADLYQPTEARAPGTPPVKPGKVGWVHGTKLAFFRGYKQDFLAAAENKSTGAFYSRISRLYLAKYGYNLAWRDNLDGDDDVVSDVDKEEDVDILLPEEAECRATYFKVLRGKIGVWYNAHYEGRFYHNSIKDRVAARWAAVSRRPNPPAMVHVRQKVTREAWDGETEAFRQEVMEAIAKEHAVAVEAYNLAITGDAPMTAEEYDVALNNTVYYLQPFADGIHERFGMNVAILMCGPIADRGGRIEVQSIHSGMSNGLVPRVWSDFDRAGFDVVQRSFVEFSHQGFTKAECHARSLNGMAMAEEDGGHNLQRAQAPIDEVATANIEDGAAAAGSTVGAVGGAPSTLAQAPAVDAGGARTAPPQAPVAQEWVPFNPLTFNETCFGEQRFNFGSMLLLHGNDSPDWINESGMGRALAREIAKMSESERGEQLEMESDLARNRLTLHRVEQGVDSADASADTPRSTNTDTDAPHRTDANTEADQPTAKTETKAGVAGGTARAASRARIYPAPSNASAAACITTWVPAYNTAAASNPCAAARITTWVPAHNTAAAHIPPPASLPQEGGMMMWGTQDMQKWPVEFRNVFRGFARGEGWGGKAWADCVQALIAFENASGFPTKGMLSAPNRVTSKRPLEVPRFMQGARKWEHAVKLASEIGPRSVEGSFGQCWWSWWGQAQPPARLNSSGEWESPSQVGVDEWKELGKMTRRNGMLLYVGGLLWWGEAAATADEKERKSLLGDWCRAVEDVSNVLAEALKERTKTQNETRGKGAGKKNKKRKEPTSAAGKENKNDAPRKRRRTTKS